MSKPLPSQNTFAALSPPWSLVSLDANFTNVWAAIDDIGTYSNVFADTGAVNAMVVAVTAPLTFALVDGVTLDVKVGNTTTSNAPTLNVAGTGAKTIVNADNTILAIGQLAANMRVRFVYDLANTVWRITSITAGVSAFVIGPPASGNALVATGIAASLAIQGILPTTGDILSARNSNNSFNVSLGTTASFAYVSGNNASLLLTTQDSTSQGITIAVNTGNVVVQAASSGVALTVNAPVAAAPTSIQFFTNGNGTGNDIDIGGSFNGPNEFVYRATSTGTSAKAALAATDASSLGLVLLAAGTNYTGTLSTGGPAGRGAAIQTNYAGPLSIGTNTSANIIISSTGNVTMSGNVGINNASPPAQVTGFGTPTGTGVIANFPGATATLAQCSQAIAELIKDLKAFGLYGA